MKHQLTIDGMSCQHCVGAVKEALESVEGVAVESVSIGSAVIEAGGDEVLALAREAVAEDGYAVRDVTPVEGWGQG